MPLTYDDIEKGRRREWKQLMDPDERKRREEEEREQDPEYQKKLSATKRRQQALKDRERRQIQEWLAARRVVLIRVGLIVLAAVLFGAVKWAVNAAWRAATYDRRSQLEAVAMTATKPYRNFDTPLDAWASWRNAWVRTDARAIIRTYSERFAKRQALGADERAHANYLQRRIREGHMDTYIDLARHFAMPEILRLPRTSAGEGDIAVLRTHPVKLRGVLGDPQPWVMVLSYDSKGKRWLVEDIRTDQSWDPRWTHVSTIQASRLPRALREEER